MQTNYQVEEYLSEVGQAMKRLPKETQQQEIEEVRQHLLALIEADQQMGISEEEATAAALRQFGAATQVGQAIRQARQQERGTALGAAALLIGVYAASVLFQIGWGVLQVDPYYSHFVPKNVPGLLNILGLGTQLLMGYLVARLAPRRAVTGTILGITALSIAQLPLTYRSFQDLLHDPQFMEHRSGLPDNLFLWWVGNMLIGLARSIAVTAGMAHLTRLYQKRKAKQFA
jgi:hypothetical protein